MTGRSRRGGGAPDRAALAALAEPLAKAPDDDLLTGAAPKPPEPKKVKMSFWVSADEAARIRATVDATGHLTGLRGLSPFIAATVLDAVRGLEYEHNGAEPWTPLASGSLPVGRPMQR